MKFFCIHHKDAEERKKYIKKNIEERYSIDLNWITSFHPTEIANDYRDKIYCEHAANQKNLNIAEISCFLKHREAIKQISRSNEFGFILEDDIKTPDFDLIKISKFIYQKMLENDCDIVFVGSFSIYDLQKKEKPYIICNQNTLSRCCHAYIVNNRSAIKICDHLKNIVAPVDWQINYAIKDLELFSCWSYPHIYQRTEKKEMSSLLR